jgi:hypothetical protein
MNHLDFAYLSGFTAAILIYMSIVRLFLETQTFGIPIMNYVSFANIVTYVLDVLYGLTYFIVGTAILMLFRGKLIHEASIYISDIALKILGVVTDIMLSSVIVFIYWGKKLKCHNNDINDTRAWILKVSVYLLIGSFGLFARYYFKIQEINLLILTMVFIFSWLFTKIVVRFEMDGWKNDKICKTIITFNDKTAITTDQNLRYVTNTMEFVFLYNGNKKSYTAIAMSDVTTIESNGRELRPKKKILPKLT